MPSFVGFGVVPWNANSGEYRTLSVGAQARLWLQVVGAEACPPRRSSAFDVYLRR